MWEFVLGVYAKIIGGFLLDVLMYFAIFTGGIVLVGGVGSFLYGFITRKTIP